LYYVIKPTAWSQSRKTCYFSTILTLLLLTMASRQLRLSQTKSSFPLRLSESQRTLIVVKFVKIPKHKFEIQLTWHLFSDKAAVSANQSGRDMETLL